MIDFCPLLFLKHLCLLRKEFYSYLQSPGQDGWCQNSCQWASQGTLCQAPQASTGVCCCHHHPWEGSGHPPPFTLGQEMRISITSPQYSSNQTVSFHKSSQRLWRWTRIQSRNLCMTCFLMWLTLGPIKSSIQNIFQVFSLSACGRSTLCVEAVESGLNIQFQNEEPAYQSWFTFLVKSLHPFKDGCPHPEVFSQTVWT